jgi:hypothetical protein
LRNHDRREAAPATEAGVLRNEESLALIRDLVQHWDAGDIDLDFDAITGAFDAARDFVRRHGRMAGEHRHPVASRVDLGLLAAALDNVDREYDQGWTPAHYARAIATEYERLFDDAYPSSRNRRMAEKLRDLYGPSIRPDDPDHDGSMTDWMRDAKSIMAEVERNDRS